MTVAWWFMATCGIALLAMEVGTHTRKERVAAACSFIVLVSAAMLIAGWVILTVHVWRQFP